MTAVGMVTAGVPAAITMGAGVTTTTREACRLAPTTLSLAAHCTTTRTGGRGAAAS